MATFKVTLAGLVFELHPLNIGEIETLGALGKTSGFMALRMAMARGNPAMIGEEFDKLEATLPELAAAAEALRRATGMEDAPGEARPATAA